MVAVDGDDNVRKQTCPVIMQHNLVALKKVVTFYSLAGQHTSGIDLDMSNILSDILNCHCHLNLINHY